MLTQRQIHERMQAVARDGDDWNDAMELCVQDMIREAEAPLVKALEGMVRWWDSVSVGPDEGTMLNEVIIGARAALRAAKGEA